MTNPMPLNGDRLLNQAQRALTRPRTAAAVLAEAFSGQVPEEEQIDTPDGTNGATKQESARVTDPTQGYAPYNRQRRSSDPLVTAVLRLANRRH